VQAYSDRELFWIVKNGIRLSGMPAFGKVESDEHIWNLVHYIRTLPAAAKAQ
jgi:mono/diheme cytochrome c family protein